MSDSTGALGRDGPWRGPDGSSTAGSGPPARDRFGMLSITVVYGERSGSARASCVVDTYPGSGERVLCYCVFPFRRVATAVFAFLYAFRSVLGRFDTCRPRFRGRVGPVGCVPSALAVPGNAVSLEGTLVISPSPDGEMCCRPTLCAVAHSTTARICRLVVEAVSIPVTPSIDRR